MDLASPNGSATPEWPGTLDVPGLLATGWRPVPFREFVLKIHSRCDLACDYCYMYAMADQSWRGRPRTMSGRTLDKVAERIAEHTATYELESVELILHGGEPLLAGTGLLEEAVSKVRRAVSGTRVDATIQTNGVGLDRGFLEMFDRLDVHVGLSLDGDATGHDRHRRHADGRGSHAEVLAALELLTGERYAHLFDGLLCTVDLGNNPRDLRRADGPRPPVVDFLLAPGNWAAGGPWSARRRCAPAPVPTAGRGPSVSAGPAPARPGGRRRVRDVEGDRWWSVLDMPGSAVAI